MRLTIERLRWLVLAVGLILLVTLGVFLVRGRLRQKLKVGDLPKRLGIEIQQETNGVTYTQSHGGHTLFKIHAAKVVELKKGSATLHDVRIELYGDNGDRVDRIEGAEFEYDEKAGTARATGPVEITLMRPGEAPAIAHKANPGQALSKGASTPLASAAEAVEAGQIHVKTSGLMFDQKSGLASTAERVEFQMAQGQGSSLGATYESGKGLLVLNNQVELATHRGQETVNLRAAHAEFERGDQVCRMRQAEVDARGARASAGESTLYFTDGGAIDHLEASGGFSLATDRGGRLTAPRAHLEFDGHNQPRKGRLEGGVALTNESSQNGRTASLHGSAPAADLDFGAEGQLRRAHLETGVQMESRQQQPDGSSSQRVWRSPTADVDFRSDGQGRLEATAIRGSGGVEVTTETSRRDHPANRSRLSAQQVQGEFVSGSVLRSITGQGGAVLEQHTPTGALQTISGDRIDARFAEAAAQAEPRAAGNGSASAPQIDSARIEGHVVLIQTPAARPGGPAQASMRATAGRADYEGPGGLLHLSQSPRIVDGALDLSADRIDFAQSTGEGTAHGSVKASWSAANVQSSGAPALGCQGPVHAVAAEAQLAQATGQISFRGQARLWQQANSISAPLIVFERTRRTLDARATQAAEPVRAALMTAETRPRAQQANGKDQPPSVLRIRSGELRYSDGERKAWLRAGVLPAVTAETAAATVTSAEAEIDLLPPGNHAGPGGGSAQVDRLTARGSVQIASQGRSGSGEQLVYLGETGEYILTGTPAAPPRISDPSRGVVTGETLIFSSRDDSVRVEGGPQKTTTRTTVPR